MEPQVLRIGNAHGFWGDRLEAAAELLEVEPELDFLTFDFLAEVSMSVLAAQRERDPEAGFPRDFLEIVESLVPYWRSGGKCRLIANAGGLDPAGCARACAERLREAGVTRSIAVVEGDDVLEQLRSDALADPEAPWLRHLDTAEPIGSILDRVVTANAYLGAEPIAEALDLGAEIVVTGRVADASLAVAACLHRFRWGPEDWDRLAGATVAGHLLECGTQLTGGIFTDWLEIPDVHRLGFPIAEVARDGGSILTKAPGSGGRVTEETVAEQLLYEVGDPNAYLTPDVTLSLRDVEIGEIGPDRVRVSGARGGPPPERLKVSATYRDGYWAAGQLTIFGEEAVRKARRAGAAVLEGLKENGWSFREEIVECLGAGACRPGDGGGSTAFLSETVLRVAVADSRLEAVETFRRAFTPLITAGPQGTTGYAEGRPRVRPLFRFWPCLMDRARVVPETRLIEGGAPAMPLAEDAERVDAPGAGPGEGRELAERARSRKAAPGYPMEPHRLVHLAHGRSGDKGTSATISVIARRREDFPRLRREVTAERVASFLGVVDPSDVLRFELPALGALNFLIHGILDSPLRTDVQGKALGQVLLEMPIEPTRRSGAEPDSRGSP